MSKLQNNLTDFTTERNLPTISKFVFFKTSCLFLRGKTAFKDFSDKKSNNGVN